VVFPLEHELIVKRFKHNLAPTALRDGTDVIPDGRTTVCDGTDVRGEGAAVCNGTDVVRDGGCFHRLHSQVMVWLIVQPHNSKRFLQT